MDSIDKSVGSREWFIQARCSAKLGIPILLFSASTGTQLVFDYFVPNPRQDRNEENMERATLGQATTVC